MDKLHFAHFTEIPETRVETEGARKVNIRWLIGKEHGAPNFATRMFRIEPGGNTPYHAHDWEHEIYILEGEGELLFEGEFHHLKPGVTAYVPAMTKHSFRSEEGMKFLCIIPIK